MKLTLIGTGPTKPVEGKGKNRRLNSGAVLENNQTKILVDVPATYEEQYSKFNILKEINNVVITHGHNDATSGIKTFEDFYKTKPIVYCEKETETRIKEDIKEPFCEFKNFEPGKEFMIDDVKIIPFRVAHSIQPGYPTVGFKFQTENESLVYSEDVGFVPKESESSYNSDVVVFDAAMWFDRQIKGHQNVQTALDFLKKFAIKLIVLTQAGHTYPNYDYALKDIEEYWKSLGDTKTRVTLAYDGMVIDVGNTLNLTEEILIEEYEGLYLPAPHAEMIWNGKKTLIVKSRMFRFAMNKDLYWLDNDYCYGVLRLTKITKLTPDMFNQLRDKHKISNEERIKWWKTPNKTLYGYDFEIVKKFDKPKKVNVPQGVQTFIKKISFTNAEVENELIKNIANYNPANMGNAQLGDDWRIACAWYASKKKGLQMKFSLEDIVNVAKLIYDEILRRIKKGTMKHEFNPEKMESHSRELLGIVSKGVLDEVKPFNYILALNSSMIDGVTYFTDIDCLCNQLYGRIC